jgi:hypothetical protein
MIFTNLGQNRLCLSLAPYGAFDEFDEFDAKAPGCLTRHLHLL